MSREETLHANSEIQNIAQGSGLPLSLPQEDGTRNQQGHDHVIDQIRNHDSDYSVATQRIGVDHHSANLENKEDSKMSVAINPVALVTTECITVTSALRKHARWAQSSVSAILGGASLSGSREVNKAPEHTRQLSASQKPARKATRLSNGTSGEDDSLASRWGLRGKKGKSMQDDPLLSAFSRLRNDLRGCTGMNSDSAKAFQMLIQHRYQDVRHPLPSTSFPPSCSIFIYLSTDNLSGFGGHYQVLCLQCDQERLAQTTIRHAASLGGNNSLPLSGQRFCSR